LNILRVRCRSAEEFRSLYNTDHPDGALFCPTTTELPSESPVVVEIACKGLPNKVLVKGIVMSWRPALPRLRIRAGALVRFSPEEAAKRDFVMQTLMGSRQEITRKRKHTRIPVGLVVRLRLGNDLEYVEAELREISVSGGLVAASVQPAIGTDVIIDIIPPGGIAPMSISGRAIYHAGPGQTGVKFTFREGGGSRRLRELVRRFKLS
jgi:hypothetical protein